MNNSEQAALRTDASSNLSGPTPTTTFGDHFQELKGRLFWVAIAFCIASAIAYPNFQKIMDLLVRPLGNQKLYYMTPAGGFSFMIKICMYVGLVGILPVIIYHLYKFIAPIMQKNRSRSVLVYTVASSVLAVGGIVFAYTISLPAALKFLNGFSLGHINALLGLDAYVSFITAYLLAGAVLFQLPLVMLIVDSITPLKPKKLMSYQRHIIVASFVAAAILSPTPDAVNQTLLAAPMVAMYQFGILLIWAKKRLKDARVAKHVSHNTAQSDQFYATDESFDTSYSDNVFSNELSAQQMPMGQINASNGYGTPLNMQPWAGNSSQNIINDITADLDDARMVMYPAVQPTAQSFDMCVPVPTQTLRRTATATTLPQAITSLHVAETIHKTPITIHGGLNNGSQAAMPHSIQNAHSQLPRVTLGSRAVLEGVKSMVAAPELGAPSRKHQAPHRPYADITVGNAARYGMSPVIPVHDIQIRQVGSTQRSVTVHTKAQQSMTPPRRKVATPMRTVANIDGFLMPTPMQRLA
jgi:sec-independent protein translocase protein TatC